MERYDQDDDLYENSVRNKMIQNSYNNGNMEYETFLSPIKIDDSVADLYKDTISENIIEERVFKILYEKIYEDFNDSVWHQKYSNVKNIDKNDLTKMYYYFKDKMLKEQTFSPTQIFIGFAEFFQVNYDRLYAEIGVLDKEELLKELNEKYSLNKKIKTKKLF